MGDIHPAYENLIVKDVIKQLSWSDQKPSMPIISGPIKAGSRCGPGMPKKTALRDRSQSRLLGGEKEFQWVAISMGRASQEIYKRGSVDCGSNHEI